MRSDRDQISTGIRLELGEIAAIDGRDIGDRNRSRFRSQFGHDPIGHRVRREFDRITAAIATAIPPMIDRNLAEKL